MGPMDHSAGQQFDERSIESGLNIKISLLWKELKSPNLVNPFSPPYKKTLLLPLTPVNVKYCKIYLPKFCNCLKFHEKVLLIKITL